MAPFTGNSVNIKGLKKLYQSDECAKALLDQVSTRKRNHFKTTVNHLMWLMHRGGKEFSRREMIDVLKQLKEYGIGDFIIGRRGQPSRFEWAVEMIGVGKAARGENAEIEPLGDMATGEVDEEEDLEVPDGAIRHTYNLRPDFGVSLNLPNDLSNKEAVRLADFIRTLPFESAESA